MTSGQLGAFHIGTHISRRCTTKQFPAKPVVGHTTKDSIAFPLWDAEVSESCGEWP